MTYSTTFGILVAPLAIDLPLLRIEPLPDYETITSEFTSALNKDGHYYPPEMHQVGLIRDGEGFREEPIPNTSRPAHLFHLASSHHLTLPTSFGVDPEREDAHFVAQLLAFLYGTRLQIDGFQFDSRIPVRPPNHHVYRGKAAVGRFLSTAYSEWGGHNQDQRARISNILYLHAKAPSYDWLWEWFLLEYVVIDALFDLLFRTYTASAVSHPARIRELCSRLGVWCPPDAPVEAIVEVRRLLFHEGLWEGTTPGYSPGQEEFERVHELRALNQRLISAYLGGRTDYTIHPWTSWRRMTEFI